MKTKNSLFKNQNSGQVYETVSEDVNFNIHS